MIFLQLYIVHISSVSTSRMSRHFSTSGIRLERKFNRGILLLGGRRFVNLTVRVAYSLRVIPWNGINFRGTQWPGSRRISRAKVAAWAVHRETLRQEDKRPTTRDTFSSLSGFSTLLIPLVFAIFTGRLSRGKSMERAWIDVGG